MGTKRGFTLVEILTAVVIVTILVAASVPLYEKTIERSRMAEARTILAKLEDAKIRAMDNMGCTNFDSANSSCPTVRHLGVSFSNEISEDGYSFDTKDFHYSINLGDNAARNGVCARRRGGDTAGTTFVYTAPGMWVGGVNGDSRFLCSGEGCTTYGLSASTLGFLSSVCAE